MKQKPVDQRVEDTLTSLEGMERASVQPWFFTRVNARLQKDENSRWAVIGSFLSKPVVALAGVSAILILNVFLLISDKQSNTTTGIAGQPEQQQLNTDNESVIASINSYNYENLVQP